MKRRTTRAHWLVLYAIETSSNWALHKVVSCDRRQVQSGSSLCLRARVYCPTCQQMTRVKPDGPSLINGTSPSASASASTIFTAARTPTLSIRGVRIRTPERGEGGVPPESIVNNGHSVNHEGMGDQTRRESATGWVESPGQINGIGA